jgi:hypothetical protein
MTLSRREFSVSEHEGNFFIDVLDGRTPTLELTRSEAKDLACDLQNCLDGRRWETWFSNALWNLRSRYHRYAVSVGWWWNVTRHQLIYRLRGKGPRCIRCLRLVHAAMLSEEMSEAAQDAWACPNNAISFEGGWNYGSERYDAITVEDDGLRTFVELIVCDDCVRYLVAHNIAREVRAATLPVRFRNREADEKSAV